MGPSAAAAVAAAAASGGRLSVPVSSDGNFTILVDGEAWFGSGAPSFRHQGAALRAGDGSLALASQRAAGGDGWRGWAQRWAGGGARFDTDVKVYDTYAVFTQGFPDGAAGTGGGGRDSVLSAYPVLAPAWVGTKGTVSFQGRGNKKKEPAGGWGGHAGAWSAAIPPNDKSACRVVTRPFAVVDSNSGYTAYTPQPDGTFSVHSKSYCNDSHEWAYTADVDLAQCEAKCVDLSCTCFDVKDKSPSKGTPPIGSGVAGTGPVVIFNEDMQTSLVLSPFSNFMAASQVFDGKAGTLSYGVMGSVTEIPKGFSVSTVVSLGAGVNAAMESWGDVLLKQYGKERYAYKRDLAMQYIGYSTDNGAYYYYQTEPDKNYEETLVDVLAYSKSVGIPYKYVLLDSWWYTKGEGGGVKTWEARADIFPDGNEGFWQKTRWPTQLHNRMWSPDTTYAKQNGGQYNFVIDGSKVAVPDDQRFWDDLIGNKSAEAGAFMYEQDWLDNEFDDSKALGENATLGRTWLMQMNNGAEHANQTIQMCMSYVRQVLQSVEMPAVTNVRASGDYHPGNSQWDTGATAVLTHAVGLAPSKDNYWSTEKQSGTHYDKGKASEPHSELQAAVSTLTNGPVAPSDKINASNVSLVMRCCDESGRLLSADRPAVEIDAHFFHAAFGSGGVAGHLWATHATVSGLRFSYAIGISLTAAYNLTSAELGYGPADKLVAVRHGAADPVTVARGLPLAFAACGEDDFQLYLIAPATGGYTLLGEPGKWVSVSPQRFSALAATAAGASVAVHGAAGERVAVRWADAAGRVVAAECSLGSDGTAMASVGADGAKCV